MFACFLAESLATAAFVLVTTEFLIVGLLPAIARDLEISISAAGLLVTLFAFTVMPRWRTSSASGCSC